jgi:hypothetical protein
MLHAGCQDSTKAPRCFSSSPAAPKQRHRSMPGLREPCMVNCAHGSPFSGVFEGAGGHRTTVCSSARTWWHRLPSAPATFDELNLLVLFLSLHLSR